MANKRKTRRDALGFGAAVVAFGVATGIDIVGASAASVMGGGSGGTISGGSKQNLVWPNYNSNSRVTNMTSQGSGSTVSSGAGTERGWSGTGPSTIQASPSTGISSIRGATGNTVRTNGGSNTIGGTSAGSGDANRK